VLLFEFFFSWVSYLVFFLKHLYNDSLLFCSPDLRYWFVVPRGPICHLFCVWHDFFFCLIQVPPPRPSFFCCPLPSCVPHLLDPFLCSHALHKVPFRDVQDFFARFDDCLRISGHKSAEFKDQTPPPSTGLNPVRLRSFSNFAPLSPSVCSPERLLVLVSSFFLLSLPVIFFFFGGFFVPSPPSYPPIRIHMPPCSRRAHSLWFRLPLRSGRSRIPTLPIPPVFFLCFPLFFVVGGPNNTKKTSFDH